jgi:hypothetical protein
MTYSVRRAPRTPSARTLAVAGAITVSALTASALTALGPLSAHAGRSHSRSNVTPAGVVTQTDQSNGPDLRAALYPFSTISPVHPSATGLFP